MFNCLLPSKLRVYNHLWSSKDELMEECKRIGMNGVEEARRKEVEEWISVVKQCF